MSKSLIKRFFNIQNFERQFKIRSSIKTNHFLRSLTSIFNKEFSNSGADYKQWSQPAVLFAYLSVLC